MKEKDMKSRNQAYIETKGIPNGVTTVQKAQRKTSPRGGQENGGAGGQEGDPELLECNEICFSFGHLSNQLVTGTQKLSK